MRFKIFQRVDGKWMVLGKKWWWRHWRAAFKSRWDSVTFWSPGTEQFYSCGFDDRRKADEALQVIQAAYGFPKVCTTT